MLQLPKQSGGLGLPNLRLYYWAAQLRAVTICLTELTETRWLNMETSKCTQVPLSAVPLVGEKRMGGSVGRWSLFTLQVWNRVQQAYHLPMLNATLTGIAHVNDFVPMSLDAGFRKQSHLNLHFVHQLLQDSQLKSFE